MIILYPDSEDYKALVAWLTAERGAKSMQEECEAKRAQETSEQSDDQLRR